VGLIRLYLALSVLLHHCHFQNFKSPSHLDGGVSVILFFIISGFYIAFVLNEKYCDIKNGVSAFYYGRAVRIFPVYLIVLLFCIIFYRSINQPSIFTDQLGLSLKARYLILLSNVFIFGQDLFNVVVEDVKNGSPLSHKIVEALNDNGAINIQSNPVYVLIGQAWSLSIELYFYLLAPFVVRNKFRIALLLIASLFARYAVLDHGFPSVPYTIRFFPSVLSFFLIGSISYHIYKIASKNYLHTSVYIGRMFLLIFVVFTAFSAPLNIKFMPGGNFDTIHHWLLYSSFALIIPFIFLYSKNSKIDGFLGEFSYPIYVVHGLVLGYMVQPINGLTINGPLLVITYSMFFSWLLICAIIKPLENAKHRRLDILSTNQTAR